VFAPGGSIFYRLTTKAPAKAQNKVAAVAFTAKATVAGIEIPYALKTSLALPMTNPVDPAAPTEFDGVERVRVGELKVPKSMPNATLSLKATVRVPGEGNVTTRTTVTIA